MVRSNSPRSAAYPALIRHFVTVGSLALLTSLLAGCGAGETDELPQAQSGSITKAQPTKLVELDPQLVSELPGFNVGSITELDRAIYVNWPQIRQAPVLTDTVQKAARADVAAFRKDYPVTGKRATAMPELLRNWSVIGSSSDMLGLLSEGVESGGASSVQIATSTWYDATTEKVLRNADLIGDQAAFYQAARASLSDIDGLRDLDKVMSGAGPGVIAFTPDGSLIAGFDEGQVAPFAMGRVEAVISSSDVGPLLSEAGQRARDSAMEPTKFGSGQAFTEETTQPSEEPSAPTPDTSAATVDCSKLKCVALTFDDGPARPTNQLLDELKSADVKATFFMLGAQVDAFPDTAKRAAAEGHELAVHTWGHPQLTKLGAAQVRSELDRTKDILQNEIGVSATLMRPPYGATNSTVAAAAKEAGLAQVNWTVDPQDWKDRNAGIVTQRVVSASGRGSIILLHDIHQSSVDAVPGIVSRMKSNGFTFVTVSQLLGDTTPGELYTKGR